MIAAALIAGVVGCGGDVEYELTITSTTGGSVTDPGEGTFTYTKGKVVNLVVTPNACCHFANWTGDVSSIADVNNRTTTITMNDDYAITANLEEEVVTFADANLEAIVREIISIPEGSIYASDVDWFTTLNATAKNITDLTGLECATGLEYLELGDNQISDISPLVNLTGLIWLELNDNQISDISPLANLTSLAGLYLWRNQVSDISPLADLTGLDRLDIWHNQISDISPLANLTGLTSLDISYNQISDISPLSNLTNLIGVYLSNNQMSDISPLANLTNLRDAFLAGNQISDISPLANLTSLLQLFLEFNQIGDISPLANLTSLAKLWLGFNQISNISPLVENQGISEGDEVALWSNPLSSDSISRYIPELEARNVTVYY